MPRGEVFYDKDSVNITDLYLFSRLRRVVESGVGVRDVKTFV